MVPSILGLSVPGEKFFQSPALESSWENHQDWNTSSTKETAPFHSAVKQLILGSAKVLGLLQGYRETVIVGYFNAQTTCLIYALRTV